MTVVGLKASFSLERLTPRTEVLEVRGGKLGRSSGDWLGNMPMLPLTSAERTRWIPGSDGANGCALSSAIGISPDVGVLVFVLSFVRGLEDGSPRRRA